MELCGPYTRVPQLPQLAAAPQPPLICDWVLSRSIMAVWHSAANQQNHAWRRVTTLARRHLLTTTEHANCIRPYRLLPSSSDVMHVVVQPSPPRASPTGPSRRHCQRCRRCVWAHRRRRRARPAHPAPPGPSCRRRSGGPRRCHHHSHQRSVRGLCACIS